MSRGNTWSGTKYDAVLTKISKLTPSSRRFRVDPEDYDAPDCFTLQNRLNSAVIGNFADCNPLPKTHRVSITTSMGSFVRIGLVPL